MFKGQSLIELHPDIFCSSVSAVAVTTILKCHNVSAGWVLYST